MNWMKFLVKNKLDKLWGMIRFSERMHNGIRGYWLKDKQENV